MKTSELIGSALDWAVAKCEGYIGDSNSWLHKATLEEGEDGSFHPSTDWAQGGPIIEREIARLEDLGDKGWEACGFGFVAMGDSPLIAAMRCYVASKLGNEVDIPEELL